MVSDWMYFGSSSRLLGVSLTCLLLISKAARLTADEHARFDLGGTVVDSKSTPVTAHVWVCTLSSDGMRVTSQSMDTAPSGKFLVKSVSTPAIVFAADSGRNEAGLVRVAKATADVRVQIAPTASVSGRLLNFRNDVSTSGRIGALVSLRSPEKVASPSCELTPGADVGPDGRFELKGLVVGQQYQLTFQNLATGEFFPLRGVTPSAAGQIELGDIRNRRPASGKDLAIVLFSERGDFEKRFLAGLKKGKGVAVILGDPEAQRSQEVAELLQRNRSHFAGYKLLPVSKNDEATYSEVRERFPGVFRNRSPEILVFDQRGHLIAEWPSSTVKNRDEEERAYQRFLESILKQPAE